MKLAGQQLDALDAIGRWMKSDQQVFRLFGFAGSGKQQPIDCAVQTPQGGKSIGELCVGDAVFSGDGKLTKITGVFPQGTQQAYIVTFTDGSSTECGLDHLWSVRRYSGGKWRTEALREILKRPLKQKGRHGWYVEVPITGPVRFQAEALPFSSYIIGILLGDGGLTGSTVDFASVDKEIPDRIASLLPSGLQVNEHLSRGPVPHYTIVDNIAHKTNRLLRHLQDEGCCKYSWEKHIPKLYLVSSVEDRLDLLRGLLDSDGSCGKNHSTTTFSTTSVNLVKDITWLVQSLGGTASTCSQKREDRRKEYTVSIKTIQCPFFLKRKRDRWHAHKKFRPLRKICSIQPSRTVKQVCIQVASQSGLYLTDNFIVTHNTTLAKHAATGSTLFAAYTGKASHVLRQKGCEAFTIHQLIYTPKDRSQKKLKELELSLKNTDDPVVIADLQRKIEFETKQLNSPNFVLNPDSPVSTADLIIVDECSMVNEQMATDLMSFGTKILVLGDPAQLPPVFGAGWFIQAKPDFMLTEIHRQAAGNPIIQLATRIRNEEWIRPDGGQVVKWGSVTPKEVLGFDQILVGRNATRKATNAKIRTLLGRTSPTPEEGDRLVCLRNDHEVGLLNGAIWETETCFDGDEFLELIIFDPECKANYTAVKAHRHHFMSDTPTQIPFWIRKEAQEFDYGYALTVHKSQGSEFDRVLIFDESSAFGNAAHKWLYTAVTRAAKEVKLVVR